MTLRRILLVVALALGAVLGVSTAAVGALRLVHSGILPGVSADGRDLGGLSEREARQELEALADTRRVDTVTLQFEDQRFRLEPEQVGYQVDVDATLERALEPGRAGGVLASSWDHVAAFWREVDVGVVDEVDEDALADWVGSVAAEVDREPFPGGVSADPDTLEVSVEQPRPGRAVDRHVTRRRVRRALSTTGPESLDLPVDVEPVRVQPAAVRRVAETARRALEEPLTLSAVGESVTLEPAALARMIELQEVVEDDGSEVRLHVPVEAVEQAFADHTDRFEVEPADARFDLPRSPPVTLDDQDDTTWRPKPIDVDIVPSRDGQTFDAEMAAAQIGQLLRAGEHEADLRLRAIEPQFTTADARDFGLSHLIGTFTTYHSCCQARVANIHRLADMVDLTRVEPGEEFSVNQISGERRCSKGFRPAGMILNGELVDVCGGGVSQFGTTTFNAAFFAGVPIEQYKAHSWYISRYPMGREATLNFPSPDIDVRWTNDTDNGILVRTSYTGTSITVSLYGDNDGRVVSAIHGEPHNYRSFSREVRENKQLPPGAQRVVQSGANGFDVVVFRVIEDGEQETRERFFTRYVPITEIVERNSDPPPEPPPGDDDAGGDDDASNGGGGDGSSDGDGGGSDGTADGDGGG